MEFLEILGNLKSVGSIEGQDKGRRIKILVTKGDTKQDVPITVFLNEGEFSIPLGSEILLKCQAKEYKGTMQYSVGLKFIKVLKAGASLPPTPKPQVAATPPKQDPVDWDGKERRMVRMNSLAHATELVKDAQSFTEAKDLEKMVKETMGAAEQFELWVYRGTK